MTSEHSRRSILAGGVVLAGAAVVGCGSESPKGGDTPTGGEQSPADTSVKTRTASCNCGQLRATCVGPDPARVSLCPCKLCQRQSGSAFAIQARFPQEQVTIEGDSTAWRFPIEGAEPVDFTHCAEEGAEFHFCPVCGSTVWYTADADDSRIGIKVGAFADPTFPPPKITGHIKYRHPWTMDLEGLSLKVVQG